MGSDRNSGEMREVQGEGLEQLRKYLSGRYGYIERAWWDPSRQQVVLDEKLTDLNYYFVKGFEQIRADEGDSGTAVQGLDDQADGIK